MRTSLPALATPAIALALLHCGSSGEKSPADAGEADRAAAPGTIDALVDKRPNGVETALTVTADHVTLDVSETPTVVLYGS